MVQHYLCLPKWALNVGHSISHPQTAVKKKKSQSSQHIGLIAYYLREAVFPTSFW
jgi:hypothetical protein